MFNKMESNTGLNIPMLIRSAAACQVHSLACVTAFKTQHLTMYTLCGPQSFHCAINSSVLVHAKWV